MSKDIREASVEIMGKVYQIKCPEDEVESLHRAASYLQDKMRQMRETGVLSVDRVAVITALNVVHQLLSVEQVQQNGVDAINQRLLALQAKIDQTLSQAAQQELLSAD